MCEWIKTNIVRNKSTMSLHEMTIFFKIWYITYNGYIEINFKKKVI